MGQSNINLAALIGSRICHDLISPIGAINNGMELLTMSGGGAGAELELINESVEAATARIRYFRIAFGAAGEQMIRRSETMSILRDLYGTGRLDVSFAPLKSQPRTMLRLTFLGLMCLESAMPYGGEVQILLNQGKWQLNGSAEKLNIDAPLWGLLKGQEQQAELQPAHVQFALLPQVAADAGCDLRMLTDTQTVTLSF
ncbi:histidine phosphotransferase family protein [Sulfitobacter aestuarii]|uniref:Histidine phosphotransferase family protein n=1 Tax=Sulfitobacter aestuarii TaxID=2161676 RepID=A0ABW5U379_9RHOB